MFAKKREKTELIVICDSRTSARKNWGVQDINRVAINAGAFSDSGPTGVHYVLPRNGTVGNGRLPAYIGQHIDGLDSRSVYIMLVGGMNPSETAEKDTYTDGQMTALLGVVRLMLTKYPEAPVVPSGLVSANSPGPSFDVLGWASEHIGTVNAERYRAYLDNKVDPSADMDLSFVRNPRDRMED